MEKGDNRPNRKKYRVRYDRIVVFVLLVAFIAVLASSCCKAISNNKKKKDGVTDIPKTEQVTPTEAEEESKEDSEKEAEPEPETPKTTVIELEKEAALKGDLVLVNADYEYTFPAADIEPVTIVGNRNDCYQAGDYNTQLDKNVLIHLNALMEAYASAMGSDKTDVFVQDGYRTFEQQQERHSSGKSMTFEAGHSDYHTGRTFDMFRYDESSATGFSYFEADSWFEENAGNYGFILRYPEGKQDKTGEKPRTYTYRYVGVPHAAYINANGLCLDEYIEEIKKYTYESALGIETGGKTYAVYYTAAAENGKTSVTVPSDKEYSVSGNNADGFIITVVLG